MSLLIRSLAKLSMVCNLACSIAVTLLASRDIFFFLSTSNNSATRGIDRTFGTIQLTLGQGSKKPVRYFLRRLSRGQEGLKHDRVPGFKAVFCCEWSVIQMRVLYFVDLCTVLFFELNPNSNIFAAIHSDRPTPK